MLETKKEASQPAAQRYVENYAPVSLWSLFNKKGSNEIKLLASKTIRIVFHYP